MSFDIKGILEDSPIIAAIKTDDGLEKCLSSDARVVFVLYGRIVNISEIVKKLKAAGKIVFVHIDLVDGLSGKEAAVEYIISATEADGIISTKASQISYAKAHGLMAIQRFFILDSIALDNLKKTAQQNSADFFEVLPGVMPKIISEICTSSPRPIIAGGLIKTKQDVMEALGAGAIAVSSTNPNVWFL